MFAQTIQHIFCNNKYSFSVPILLNIVDEEEDGQLFEPCKYY